MDTYRLTMHADYDTTATIEPPIHADSIATVTAHARDALIRTAGPAAPLLIITAPGGKQYPFQQCTDPNTADVVLAAITDETIYQIRATMHWDDDEAHP